MMLRPVRGTEAANSHVVLEIPGLALRALCAATALRLRGISQRMRLAKGNSNHGLASENILNQPRTPKAASITGDLKWGPLPFCFNRGLDDLPHVPPTAQLAYLGSSQKN